MKRLIDTKKKVNFKNWVIQHDPKLKWDFDNPERLQEQLIEHVQDCGDLDVKTLFQVFFSNGEEKMSYAAVGRFLNKNY